MIQRIQSIYLFIASLLMFFLTGRPLAEIKTVEGDVIQLFMKGLSLANGQMVSIGTWPLAFLIIATLSLGLISIFLYKNRTRQMRVCMFTILLMFGLVGLTYFYARFAPLGYEREDSVLLWPAIVPFISIILTYLAIKSIQKDDAKVKAWERLR